MKIFDGGKSNSTIFPTNDQRFVLKIITNDERLVLLSILQGYYERICKEPDSKLVRIYGLFSIFPDKIHLMLMENIVTDRENAVIFDLKGSLVNRKSKISSFPITDSVLKDENYLENSIKIILDEENEKILNTIRDDFQFLFEQEIIDYSLLIGFEYEKIRTNRSLRLSDSVKIGIIDILQKYTKKKKYEKRLKSIFYDAFQISAADPASYFARISGFLNQIFISNNS